MVRTDSQDQIKKGEIMNLSIGYVCSQILVI